MVPAAKLGSSSSWKNPRDCTRSDATFGFCIGEELLAISLSLLYKAATLAAYLTANVSIKFSHAVLFNSLPVVFHKYLRMGAEFLYLHSCPYLSCKACVLFRYPTTYALSQLGW